MPKLVSITRLKRIGLSFVKKSHRFSRQVWHRLHSLSYKQLLIIATLLSIFIVILVKIPKFTKVKAGWYNDLWDYRMSIGITNTSGSPQNNFVVQLSVNTASLISASKMQPSCNDIRFTDNTGNLLSFFVSNCNSATTAIFVKLAYIPTTASNIFLYYGNPAAAASGSAPNTFDFTSEPINGGTNAYMSLINGTPTITNVNSEGSVYQLDTVPMIKYGGTNDATAGNHYSYRTVTTGIGTTLYSGYLIKAGDYITWLEQDTTGGSSMNCGVEMDMSGGTYLRSGAGDQDAVLAVLGNTKTNGNWYWRRVSLASYVGRTVTSVDLVSEGDTASTAWSCYFNNITIRPYAANVTQGASGSEEKSTSPVAYFSFDEGFGSTIHNKFLPNGEFGLLSWFKFNEGSGTVAYDESGRFNQTLGPGGSSPAWVSARVGNGLNYNGVNQYSSYTDTTNSLTGSYSYETWIYRNADNSASYERIFSKSDLVGGYDMWFQVEPGNRLGCGHNKAAGSYYTQGTGTTLAINSWTHVACTFNSATGFTLYINGKSVIATTTGTLGPARVNSNTYNLGRLASGGAWYYSLNAIIDNFKIFNRVLAPNEISADYNYGNGDLINYGNIGAGATWFDGAQASSRQKPMGRSLKFNGSNQNITVGNEATYDFERTQPFTLSAWIKTTYVAGTINLLSKMDGALSNRGYEIQYVANLDRLQFNFQNTEGSNEIRTYATNVTTTLSNGQWHHVVLRYDGSSTAAGAVFYIDSLARPMTIQSNSLAATALNSVNFNIGARSGNAFFWNGQIDELKVFDYALSQDQISREYNRAVGVGLGVGQKTSDPKINGGLVGWWTFDEGKAFTAYDKSGLNNNGFLGTGTSAPTWAHGNVGGAVNFTGGGQYVSIPDSPAFNSSNISVTGWIKPTAYTSSGTLFNRRTAANVGGITLEMYGTTGLMRCYIYISGAWTPAQSSIPIPLNNWTNVTCTYDGAKINLYYNGVNVGTSAVPGVVNNPVSPSVEIGRNISGPSTTFSGYIDNVKLYNRALSEAEVAYEFNQGGPVTHFNFDEGRGSTVHDQMESNSENGLVRWWKMDETAGTVVADETRSGDGTALAGTNIIAGKFRNGRQANAAGTGITFTPFVSGATWTMSMWLQFPLPANTGSWWTLFANNGGSYHHILINETTGNIGSYNAAFYDTGYSTTGLAAGWHQIAASAVGGTTTFYIDSLKVGQVPIVVNYNVGILGNYTSAAGTQWIGNYDQAKIYNRALSASEIAADYSSTWAEMVNFGSAGVGATWQDGASVNSLQKPLGKSLKFIAASNNYVYVPNSPTIDVGTSQDFTITLWVNTTQGTAVNTWPMLVNKEGYAPTRQGYSIMIHDSNASSKWSSVLYYGGTSCALYGKTDISDGKWHFLSLKKNGTVMTSYQDGALTTTTNCLTNSLSNTEPAYIGGHATNSMFYFGGNIDDYKFYRYALSDADINAAYNRGAAVALAVGQNPNDADQQVGTTSSLTGWWKMDENNGAALFDSSGNNNNAAAAGSLVFSNGKFGTGLKMDYSTNTPSAPSAANFSPSNKYTISGWFNPRADFSSSSEHIQTLIDKGDYQMYLDRSDGEAHFVANSNSPKVVTDLNVGVGGGPGSYKGVYGMVVWRGDLYAAGLFESNLGTGTTLYNVAKWNGTSWSALGQGLNTQVNGLTVWRDRLIAFGNFTYAVGTGTTLNKVAMWDGSTWSALGVGITNGSVNAAVGWNGKLYFGGSFSAAGGIGTTNFASWDGTNWSAESNPGFNNQIYTLFPYKQNLYIAGMFKNNSVGTSLGGIVKYNGAGAYTTLGTGVSGGWGAVATLGAYKDKLVVGGYFFSAGGIGASNIATWDGANWGNMSGLYGGVGVPYVNGFTTIAGVPYIVGTFGYELGTGNTLVNFAKWNGSNWVSAVTPAGINTPYCLAAWKGDLFAGGGFFNIGGTNAQYIAKLGDNTVKTVDSVTSFWPANSWNHYAVTADGTTMKMYINGILENTATTSITLTQSGLAQQFGRAIGSQNPYGGDSDESFVGTLDNVRTFNRALTSGEVSYEYNQGAPIAYWPFNEKQDQIAHENIKPDATQNLIANPSFEIGTSGWSSNGTASWTSEQAYAGKYSYKVVATSGQYAAFGLVPVTVGTAYSASIWVYIPTGASARLVTDWYNGGTYLSNVSGATFNGSNAWVRVTIPNYTPAANANRANHWVQFLGAGSYTYYVDAFQFEKSIGVSPYCDGSQVGAGNAWSGTVGNSTSNCHNSLDGTLTLFPTDNSQWVAGHSSNALSFNGSSQFVSVAAPNAINFGETTPFSISAWVKRSTTGTSQYIINKQQNVTNEFIYGFQFTTADKFNFSVGKQNVLGVNSSSVTTITAGTWYHLAGTYDGNTLKTYVNGNLEATNTRGFSASTQSLSTLYYGVAYNGTMYFGGALDEVKFYPYALTDNQVKTDMNNGSAVRLNVAP